MEIMVEKTRLLGFTKKTNKTFSQFNHARFCDIMTFTCIDRQRHVEREFKNQQTVNLMNAFVSSMELTYITEEIKVVNVCKTS